jgi:glycosyltransferase involved in cell wall biosynthesis
MTRASHPHRILFVDHTARMGGGEIALLNLVKHLDPARVKPIVLLFSDGPLAAELKTAGIETHILPLSAEVTETRKDAIGGSSLLKIKTVGLTLRHAWRVARFIRANQIDLVHTNSLKADLIGGIASRAARKPAIWHVRDRIHEEYLPRNVAKMFRFLAGVIPTAIITNSQATLDTLEGASSQAGGARPGFFSRRVRKTVVHDGTLVEELSPVAQEIPSTDRLASLASPDPQKSTSPKIGILGRITKWKGQDVFLNAAARIREKYPQARFSIVGAALFGERDFETHLHELCDSLKLNDVVAFEGFRADVPAVLASWDILVHASTVGEPFGQVIIEAMALAKPVVAANGGGVPEIIRDNIDGLLTAPGDDAALAEAVCKLLADPTLAQTLARAGRQRVIDQFTIQHVARNVERVYDQMLGD